VNGPDEVVRRESDLVGRATLDDNAVLGPLGEGVLVVNEGDDLVVDGIPGEAVLSSRMSRLFRLLVK
jgi:hypothetical protein